MLHVLINAVYVICATAYQTLQSRKTSHVLLFTLVSSLRLSVS